MLGRLIAYLSLNARDWTFESAWAFQSTTGELLGLAWVREKYRRARLQPEVDLVFVDCRTGEIKNRDSYRWQGIGVENMQLWSSSRNERWVFTWEGFPTTKSPNSILLCPVQLNVPLSSALAVHVDEAFDDMSRIGPMIFATVTNQDTSLVYLKPDIDDVGSSSINVKYLQAGSADESIEVGTALRATLLAKEDSWQIIRFDVEWDHTQERIIEIPSSGITKTIKNKPYWRFWVEGGTIPITEPVWQYQLHLRIPAHAYPYSEFWNDVVSGATIIPGPHWQVSQQSEPQSTLIVAVGLIKKEAIGLPDEQARPLRGGELICLSATGQVVQECKEEIVEQIELCLVGDVVIGVDRIQRRWRVWKWEPLAGREQFTMVRWLDEDVVHAHVAINHENSDPQGIQYWLVEERPKGLRVSQCDGQTLAETEPPLDLPGWSLPAPLERSVGHFDWPVKKGIIGHDDALLLIAADEQSRMVLYRVEAGDGR